ncbi:MAG: hypothetical protein E4H02_11755 [Lentisphaerales bacterium]|nr:MAG: hypothetical protein E4H02_11755 [Lentisphaerales bacterium]
MVAFAKPHLNPHTPDTAAKDSGLRFYSPEISRWLSRDQIGEDGGVALYGFVGNVPTRTIDTLGNQAADVDAPAKNFTLSASTRALTLRYCGEHDYTRHWQLTSSNNKFAPVGHIIQRIHMLWEKWDCKNNKLEDTPTEPIQYWEAFKVKNGIPEPLKDSWQGGDEGKTLGHGYIFGSAFYFDGDLPMAGEQGPTHNNPWQAWDQGDPPHPFSSEDPPWANLPHIFPFKTFVGQGVTWDSDKLWEKLTYGWDCCCGRKCTWASLEMLSGEYSYQLWKPDEPNTWVW